MSDVLLDTSVVIQHLRRKSSVLPRVKPGSTAFVTTTVLGELWHGIYKSDQPQKGAAGLAEFLKQVGILHPDEATAERYGNIVATLERKGIPIPSNDIWIAAIALECGLPVATQDRHFQRMEGLEVLLWNEEE